MRAIPPPDEAAHLDSVFIAEVAGVNSQLSRYLLRLLDADAGRAEPLSVADERALAERVAAVAEGLRSRAGRRDQHCEPLCVGGRDLPEATGA
jgi:hypothetical protein